MTAARVRGAAAPSAGAGRAGRGRDGRAAGEWAPEGVAGDPRRSGGRCDTADLLAGLFRDEAARLVTMAGRCAVDRTAAEDLVQEAFLRLARARGRIRDPDRTTAYLRSIVLNLARDHNRRSLVARRVLPPCQPEPPSVEQVVSARESHGELVAALRALPHRQREAVVLRYYLELPVADVAASLGVSVNSTKTHLQRGLRALQLALVPAR